MTSARPANAARAVRRDSVGTRRLADREDLRDRVPDRRDEVRHELGAGAQERRVVVGMRVVGPDDEPLEVVDVRVEPVGERPATMSRATSAGSGVWTSSSPEPRVEPRVAASPG